MTQLGLIGSGNMARAMARGWGRPVLCTDSGSGRAAALATELGGERLATNAEVAARADVLVLAHKPYQLDAVAREIGDYAGLVLSVLGGVRLDALRAAFPAARVAAVMPNTATEVRRGVCVVAAASDELERVRELLSELGTVMVLDEALLPAATGVAGVGPAYVALLAEAWADAALRAGVKAPDAMALVLDTLSGTVELLRAQGGDTLAVRRGVTSPGGTTARGLRALEAGGLRESFHAAMDATTGTTS